MSYQRWNGDKQMQENMKEYLTEKEAREKRLEVYTEKIQEKVLSAVAGYQRWLYWRNMRMHLENILK